MRISDWSSDVFSSYLWRLYARCWPGRGRGGAGKAEDFGVWGICARNDDSAGRDAPGAGVHILAVRGGHAAAKPVSARRWSSGGDRIDHRGDLGYAVGGEAALPGMFTEDRKSTRLNSSH